MEQGIEKYSGAYKITPAPDTDPKVIELRKQAKHSRNFWFVLLATYIVLIIWNGYRSADLEDRYTDLKNRLDTVNIIKGKTIQNYEQSIQDLGEAHEITDSIKCLLDVIYHQANTPEDVLIKEYEAKH